MESCRPLVLFFKGCRGSQEEKGGSWDTKCVLEKQVAQGGLTKPILSRKQFFWTMVSEPYIYYCTYCVWLMKVHFQVLFNFGLIRKFVFLAQQSLGLLPMSCALMIISDISPP